MTLTLVTRRAGEKTDGTKRNIHFLNLEAMTITMMAKRNHGYRSLKLRYGTSPKNGLGRRWFPLEMAWYFVCACELSVCEVV